MTPFEFLPHTADIRVMITSDDWPGLLEAATDLVRVLMIGDSEVAAGESRLLEVRAETTDELFLRFLRELLYIYETQSFIPAELDLRATTQRHIKATLVGECFDQRRHLAEPEVKAVTRHGLDVTHTAAGWRAEVVFDV